MFHRVVRELIGCALLAGCVAVAACTSLTGSSSSSVATTTFVPVSGIQVDANGLFERDGCGHGPGVPFKYVTWVFGIEATPIAISVNDCFADAVFQINAIQGVNFTLRVDVFNDVTYANNLGGIVANVYEPATCCNPATDPPTCSGQPPINCTTNTVFLANPTAANAAAVDAIANWQTTCVVQQLSGVQSVAACQPIVATGH